MDKAMTFAVGDVVDFAEASPGNVGVIVEIEYVRGKPRRYRIFWTAIHHINWHNSSDLKDLVKI